MSLAVTAKVFHSLAARPRRLPHLCALMPEGEHIDIHTMITQHPSTFQRTSVVLPDWPILVLFWLNDWESLLWQRDNAGV